jgi:cytochrome P450
MATRYPPGPKSISPWGVTAQFRQDPLSFIMAMLHDYGDFVTLPGPFYQPGFLLNNPDLLYLDAIVYKLIEKRRRSVADTGDLLSMFLLVVDEETGEQMTDLQVRDEVMTMFIAGHETTALTLTWAWVLLAQHPSIEAKLQAELEQTLGNRPPALADLAKLAYTEMIVKEVLRLYPPAWIILRQSLTEVELGGYRLSKNAIISIIPYAAQRHPRYYEQPEEFRPERFSPNEAGDTLEKRLPRFAYFPLGGGPRICIGNSFAMMEARLLLATIAQRFRLQLPPGHQVEVNPLATLGCKGSVPMKIIAR